MNLIFKVYTVIFTLSPKWDSVRTVPIIDTLVPYLKSQLEITAKNSEFVFVNTQNQNYWDISKIRESKWKKNLIRVDVKYRPIHKTRSTFISTLISSGEDINYVSKIVGHKTVRMTLEKYSKYIPQNHVEFGKCFA
ncbi:MAG: tyrosine-type recombinase/integrase [Helicobacteraceae bacterium]|nr:tyrosine-type recombinase/integrase [Helicobacteraceae bacterium]